MAFPGMGLEGSTDTMAAAELDGQLLEAVRRRERVSRNVNVLNEEQLTLGQRLADVAGSWGSISTLLLSANICGKHRTVRATVGH